MEGINSFILIGNYPRDNQESMERFSVMLAEAFESAGYKTIIWKPKVIFGTWFKVTNSGIAKWFGYIDKWIIFPGIIKFRLLTQQHYNMHFHICDHSNAFYLNLLPKNKTAITCHDVLAIRGALGYADTYCPASKFGKLLQKSILKNLKQARSIAAVSELTLKQLTALSGGKDEPGRNWKVIYNAFNAHFAPISQQEEECLLTNIGINASIPFILHVGSSLHRKNRNLLIDMVANLGDNWNGLICFAGKPIDDKLQLHAEKKGLSKRIISIVKPTHSVLVALYSRCEAFIFPSFSEGFGWPVIEAQACGAPVIASNVQPMPEISGGAALHADPTNPEEFAKAFLLLKNLDNRKAIIEAGFKNCLRFKRDYMIREYIDLHFKRQNLSTH